MIFKVKKWAKKSKNKSNKIKRNKMMNKKILLVVLLKCQLKTLNMWNKKLC